MSLAPGAKLDHYEIVERIGVGGMGEVFRARDTRLPREVAIKVSTQAFNERFAREAKVIASLNHPNICTLFDVGPNYLVMELVEGSTLQDHIKQGPMSLEEASRIGRQIADALDYAHEHGVIHRDLKPANIKVRPDGVVKVLDFGLAKAIQISNPDDVATVTLGVTQAGAILGTPNYMSPEQATGRPTDKRSDTWAFGIVFYEMLAGGKPFGGSTIQETIAATLRDAPDLSRVPPQARRLLRKCLEKDPQNRLKHLGDVMSLLDEPPSVELAPGSVPSAPTKRNRIWPALAAVGLLSAVGVGTLHFGEQPVPREVVRFDFNPPPGVTLTRTGSFSISPDGKTIAFAGTEDGARGTHFWLRRLDSTEMHRLDLPTDADPFPPIWSPDGRFLVYENGDNVMKADIANGTAQVLCEKCSAIGGAWGRDGTILLGGGLSSISRVPESGGPPVKVIEGNRSKGEAALHPVLLPDGKHFLYLMAMNDTANKIGLKVGSVDLKPEQQSKEWLVDTGAGASWIPPAAGYPGQILYLTGNTLMARAFDPDKLVFTGEPTPVASQVGYVQNLGWGLFSASRLGHLVYRTAAQSSRQQLTWFDRAGRELGKVGDPGAFQVVTLSPDGKRAAAELTNNGPEDIWIEDLAAGTRTRLTTEASIDSQPVWSRDGANIFYDSLRGDHWAIVRRPANGAAGEEVISLLPRMYSPNVSDSSPDGKLLVYHAGGGAGGAADIWQVEAKAGSTPKALLQTQFQDVAARISPDGRWYLYRNNESGRNEIYVQAMPGYGAPAGKWLVSRDGSIGGARWRRDGREVLFLSLDGALMAADIKLSPAFESGPPHKLFDVPAPFKIYFNGGVPGSLFDMTADAERFLFAVPVIDGAAAPFQVNTDWRASLGK